jgi:hypothetical protein
MNSFRDRGYVSYDRRGIRLYRGALRQVIDGRGLPSADSND